MKFIHILIDKITASVTALIMSLGMLSAGMVPMTVSAANSYSDNEEKTFTYLTETAGFSNAAACGIMGGIYTISKFEPTASSDDGYGLCGWSGSRLTNLKKESNYESLNTQLKFMVKELKDSYSNIYSYITSVNNSATGAYNAGYRFVHSYAEKGVSDAASAGTNAKETYWPGFGSRKTSSSSSSKSSSSSSSKKSSGTTTYYVYNCSWLNYRTSPSKSSSKNIAGQFKKGTAVKCENGYSKKVGSTTWYRFTKSGKKYYISSKYLTKKKPSSSSSSSSKKKSSSSSSKKKSSSSSSSSKKKSSSSSSKKKSSSSSSKKKSSSSSSKKKSSSSSSKKKSSSSSSKSVSIKNNSKSKSSGGRIKVKSVGGSKSTTAKSNSSSSSKGVSIKNNSKSKSSGGKVTSVKTRSMSGGKGTSKKSTGGKVTVKSVSR